MCGGVAGDGVAVVDVGEVVGAAEVATGDEHCAAAGLGQAVQAQRGEIVIASQGCADAVAVGCLKVSSGVGMLATP